VPRCVACEGSHLSGECPLPRGQPQCCSCGGAHTTNYRDCVKLKEAKAAHAKQAPGRGPKSTNTGKSPTPTAKQAVPSEQQLQLGEGWSHVARRGRVVKATHPPTNPIPVQVTDTRTRIITLPTKTAKPKKPAPKTPAGLKAASAKQVAAKAVATHHPPTKLVATTHTTSPLEGITDLLDQLPIKECVELTRGLITSISSLPTGAARPRAVLKSVILFAAEYGSTP
jgi:hypothetical protein